MIAIIYKRRLTAPTPNNVVVTINATIILVISMKLIIIRVFIYIKEMYVDILLFIVLYCNMTLEMTSNT